MLTALIGGSVVK